ncbi:hypothetical protein F5X99DRAFT_272816 [Biscogniauxia marginata]|nr:hypothetical protein F5X99DRAFT_272816 [Biscogniauxia marginata]
MLLQSLVFLLSIAALGAAENTVERDDVPRACLQTCQYTIDLTARCDRSTDDDDAYRPCVCGESNARARIEECAACVRQNGMRDPDDNDVADLMDDCGWDFNQATGSFSSSSSTPTQTQTQTQTTPTQTTVVVTSSSSLVTLTTSMAGAETTTDSASSTPTGAAPIATAGVFPLVAGLIVGLPILL